MPNEKIPSFKSEKEELDFWDTHDIAEFDDGPEEELKLSFSRRKQSITLILDEGLIEDLKKAASKHGISYQTFAAEVLRHAVRL